MQNTPHKPQHPLKQNDTDLMYAILEKVFTLFG